MRSLSSHVLAWFCPLLPGLAGLLFALHAGATEYIAPSRAIEPTGGHTVQLLSLISSPPLGLPAMRLAADNLPTEAKIALGRKLFFDRRLSFNGTLSCAMCHIPEQGFAQNELATPVGIEGRSVKRNAPGLYNVAYRTVLFHDGRERTLESQIWSPLLAVNEMGNPSIGTVLEKLSALEGYQSEFVRVFGEGINVVTLGRALASYQRALLSADSPHRCRRPASGRRRPAPSRPPPSSPEYTAPNDAVSAKK